MDTEVTGQGEVVLQIASTVEDGIFIAYLEDVAPDGTVVYVTELRFRLLPTSYEFHDGHAIRISLAGADRDHFDRIPPEGEVSWRLHRGGRDGSRVTLPVVSPDQ